MSGRGLGGADAPGEMPALSDFSQRRVADPSSLSLGRGMNEVPRSRCLLIIRLRLQAVVTGPWAREGVEAAKPSFVGLGVQGGQSAVAASSIA